MSLVNDLKIHDDVEDDGDVLGGGGGYVWESGIYPVTIDMAYLSKANSGAIGLNLVLKDQKARELKNILWIQSGDEKDNRSYYVGKDGSKHNLPGLNIANALGLLSIGKELKEMVPVEKTVAIYDFDAGAEVNTQVDVYMDLLDQPVSVAVLKQIVDKNKLNETTKKWEASGEVRDQNEIAAVFRSSDMMTVTEVKAGEPTAMFHEKWMEKWDGVTQEKAKFAGKGAKPGAPTPAATAPSSTKKLFN